MTRLIRFGPVRILVGRDLSLYVSERWIRPQASVTAETNDHYGTDYYRSFGGCCPFISVSLLLWPTSKEGYDRFMYKAHRRARERGR